VEVVSRGGPRKGYEKGGAGRSDGSALALPDRLFSLSVAKWPSRGCGHSQSPGKSLLQATLWKHRNEKSGRPRVLLLRSVVLGWWRDHRGSAETLSCPFLVSGSSEGRSYRHREPRL
jgi:hypothetical protein